MALDASANPTSGAGHYLPARAMCNRSHCYVVFDGGTNPRGPRFFVRVFLIGTLVASHPAPLCLRTQEMSRMNTKSVASSALTVVACVLCMVLVMRPTVVSGASMMPTLHDKDVLITSPLAKRLFQPTRGDIVTICLSANPLCGFVFSKDTQYVKRIVAVPGDVVRYSSCNIFVTTGTGQKVKDTEPNDGLSRLG